MLHREIVLKYLQFWNCGFAGNSITPSILSKLHKLKFLYLTYNHIQHIQSHAFNNLEDLELLEIKRNRIHILMNMIFTGLQRLPKLDLSQISIVSLQSNAFFGLTNVIDLNLSFNPIKKLHNNIFSKLYNLQLLDLRHTKLLDIDQQSLLSRGDVIIYLDNPVYCCYLLSHQHCYVGDVLFQNRQQCKILMSTRIAYTAQGISIIFIILLNLVNIILLRKNKMSRSHVMLCKHLNITNSLLAIYLLLLCIGSLLFNNNYIYMSTKWSDSYLCDIMHSIPEVGFVSSRCCVFLIVLDQLIAIKYALKQQRIRSIRLLFFLYASVILVISCHIVRVIHINISNVTCYPFAVATTDTLLELFIILEVTVISIIVITSTSLMYYTIIKTVQKSSRKIRSSNKTNKTIISIIQHAVRIIGIEVVNLLSISLLSSISFYWNSNTTSRANNIQSSHVQSSHVQSSHVQSSHVQSSHAQSSHAQSSHAQSSHVQSSHVQSSHVQSSHAQSSHAQSSHVQSSHVQSSHVQSSHGQSSHVQSSHAQSYSTQNTISALISIMSLLMSSLHVVFFGLKQYRRNRTTGGSTRITYTGTSSEREREVQ